MSWLCLIPCIVSAAELTVTINDDAGAPAPCRAWIEINGERLFIPTAPDTAVPYPRDRSFSCDGAFTFADLPAGRAVVHIEKGKEFRTINRAVELSDDAPLELTLTFRRWIDMPAEHWYSADMHIHLGADDPRILTQLALADDLHLSPVFTYWLRGNESSWPADWPATPPFAPTRTIDPTHLLTYANIEIERIRRDAVPGGSIGASFLYNLTRPVTAQRFGEHHPTDAALILEARRRSPLLVVDTDKPSWAETVVGAALGCYDTVQLANNHYHRDATIPGGYGMIGPLDPGESNAAAGDGLFHRTNNLYYRFLRCGFRLAASGGSAIGVMPVPNGYNRTYAQLSGPLTAENYWLAVKAGRTFATSGPILTMTVNDQPLGSTLSLASGGSEKVTASVRLRSIHNIESLELIHDGTVTRSIDLRNRSVTAAPADANNEGDKDDSDEDDPAADPLALDITERFELTPARSGFIAARALFRAPDGLLRQAHTSPVYLIVDGRPIAHADDARYMIRWIDALTAIAQTPARFPADTDRDSVLALYRQARSEYERIEQRAIDEWGDR